MNHHFEQAFYFMQSTQKLLFYNLYKLLLFRIDK